MIGFEFDANGIGVDRAAFVRLRHVPPALARELEGIHEVRPVRSVERLRSTGKRGVPEQVRVVAGDLAEVHQANARGVADRNVRGEGAQPLGKLDVGTEGTVLLR